jgi:hypothetical protein
MVYFFYFFVKKKQYALIAQSVEQLPFKEMVAGSNPAKGTIKTVGFLP